MEAALDALNEIDNTFARRIDNMIWSYEKAIRISLKSFLVILLRLIELNYDWKSVWLELNHCFNST